MSRAGNRRQQVRQIRSQRTVVTYEPKPVDQDALAEHVAPIAHGALRWRYTIDDLDHAARMACKMNRHLAGDTRERYDLAWSAAAEALYAATEQPEFHDLVWAANRAVDDAVAAARSMHGIPARGPHRDLRGAAPKFATYWLLDAQVVPSHEPGIVDAIALQQILTKLTDVERRALYAYAAAGDRKAAAQLLGVSFTAAATALGKARVRFRTWWHEGETPSGHWRQSRGGARTDARSRMQAESCRRWRQKQKTARGSGGTP
jgi:hypothetical protein